MRLSRSWLVASTLVCSTAAGAQGASAVSPLPHFEKTTCAGPLAQDDKAECGILSVPENRSSEKSRVTHLPVVVLHSRAPGAPRDAVLFMTGGPGLSSVSGAPTSRDVIFTEDRDYVLLEQRGAPNADPALPCPEMAAPKSEIAAGRLKGAPADKALGAAARKCRNRLVSEGADLAGYTSAETAADIEDLRKALGYGASGFAWGLRYSVWCSEEFPFEDRSAIAAQVSPAEGLGGLNLGTLPPEVCDAWQVPSAPTKENQPVVSSVPTLIMAGEFDPDTPPAWGQQLVGPLSHAYFVELRGRSHVAGYYRCGQQVAAEFVRHPEKAPALDCILSARGVEFAAQPKLE